MAENPGKAKFCFIIVIFLLPEFSEDNTVTRTIIYGQSINSKWKMGSLCFA
jgi:hypothetical protein